MGTPDGSIAKSWRHEFQKNNIAYDEIVLIGNNLGELERPEFIPNVFQLISLVNDLKNDLESKVAHERVPMGLPYLIRTQEEIEETRKQTKQARIAAMASIYATINKAGDL